MTDKTKIEWTTHTWNPWQGCTKVSPGCDNCYMHAAKKRYGQDPSVVVRSKPPTFNRPLGKKWKYGEMVFVCSWSDFFHPDADEWRPEAWEIMRQRPDLIFQILTKRPHLISKRLPLGWRDGWHNVWLGATTENQKQADIRIPELLQIPAVVRFVSIEPMLGPVDVEPYFFHGPGELRDSPGGQRSRVWDQTLHWVIVGGETGSSARPMLKSWVESVSRECRTAGIPYFFKKWGVFEGRMERELSCLEAVELERREFQADTPLEETK